jgi:hypothetical protein
MVVTLNLANSEVQASWVWHVSRPTWPWTWRIAKSKHLGSDTHVRPTLCWTWLKSNCLGSDMFARPTLPWTGQIAKSKCFGFDWLPSPSVLDMASIRPNMPGVWHFTKHLHGWAQHNNKPCSFPWAYLKEEGHKGFLRPLKIGLSIATQVFVILIREDL